MESIFLCVLESFLSKIGLAFNVENELITGVREIKHALPYTAQLVFSTLSLLYYVTKTRPGVFLINLFTPLFRTIESLATSGLLIGNFFFSIKPKL